MVLNWASQIYMLDIIPFFFYSFNFGVKYDLDFYKSPPNTACFFQQTEQCVWDVGYALTPHGQTTCLF